MELVKPQPAHEHVEGGVCMVCFKSGENAGWQAVSASGWEAAMEETPSPDYVRAEQADELREVAETAHRQARHAGRFEVCREAMCAAIELWLHFESRPVAGQSSKAAMERMVRG
jgi:hypothetical protein